MLYSAYSDVCQLNSINSNVKLTLILAYSKGLWTTETYTKCVLPVISQLLFKFHSACRHL